MRSSCASASRPACARLPDRSAPRRPGPGRRAAAGPLATRTPPLQEPLRREFPALAFTPDRLVVVKGGPAARRAYFDRVLARLDPPRGGLSQEYASTLAQRNAALRRVQLGLSPTAALSPWTTRLAVLAAGLAAARAATRPYSPRFRGGCGRPRPSRRPARLHARAAERADLDASRCGHRARRNRARAAPRRHPHPLRRSRPASFGSQGEQRSPRALAEAELLPPPPCCSTTCSPSSTAAARACWRAVADADQAVITTTHRSAYPAEAGQVVEVTRTGSVTRSAASCALRPAGGPGRPRRALAGHRGWRDQPERLARADRPRRDGRDPHLGLDLGVRARPSRPRSPGAWACRRSSSCPPPARAGRASAGVPSARADPGSGRRSGIDRGVDRRPGAP